MRKRTIVAAVSCLFCLLPAVFAQESPKKETGQEYVFSGFGAANTEDGVVHFGGGAEANLYKGLGIGVELGYLGPTEYLQDGVGVLSVDGQYTFGTGSPSRLRPFLMGGYSVAFRNGLANAVNFGGGVHYWFSRRAGLRLEFRDHLSPDLWNVHVWQGRVGFDFR